MLGSGGGRWENPNHEMRSNFGVPWMARDSFVCLATAYRNLDSFEKPVNIYYSSCSLVARLSSLSFSLMNKTSTYFTFCWSRFVTRVASGSSWKQCPASRFSGRVGQISTSSVKAEHGFRMSQTNVVANELQLGPSTRKSPSINIHDSFSPMLHCKCFCDCTDPHPSSIPSLRSRVSYYPITRDYHVSRTVVGTGFSGIVRRATHRQTGHECDEIGWWVSGEWWQEEIRRSIENAIMIIRDIVNASFVVKNTHLFTVRPFMSACF